MNIKKVKLGVTKINAMKSSFDTQGGKTIGGTPTNTLLKRFSELGKVNSKPNFMSELLTIKANRLK